MLHQQIQKELVEAMKAKEALRLTVLRGIKTALTNELVATGHKPTEELSDENVLAVIRRLAKQRKEAIEQFTKGGRQDLAETEEQELAILESYLPQMMSKDDIRTLAAARKSEMDIEDKSKAGMLMGALMKELKGQADGNDVKEVVDALFTE